MTATATAPGKEIAPAFVRGMIALRRHEKTIIDVMDDLLPAAPEHEVHTEVVPFPAIPKTPILTKEAKAALNRLPNVFAKVLVEERRALTTEEIKALAEERATLKLIVKALTGREAVINENIRTHVDVDHEARGVAVPKDKVSRTNEVIVEATPRDAAGHYIFAKPQNPTRVPIPDSNEEFSLEYKRGSGQVVIDGDELLALYEEGEVTREEYLAMTREMRVFDQEKASKAAEKNPRVMEILLEISRRQISKPGTSLFVRAVK
jgi:hypothetical protein